MGSACLNGLMGWKRESRPHPVPRRLRRGCRRRARHTAPPGWTAARARLYQLLLGSQQIALGIQHFQEGGRAVVVAQLGQACAFALRFQVGSLDRQLLSQPVLCAQRIGHLAEGRLNGFFVSGDGDVAAHFAQLQIGAAAPAIEDGQRQGGHEGPGATAGIEQTIQVGAGRAEAAGQRNARQKRRAGRADVGIAGTQLVFGGNDVRATDQQLRRQTGPQLSQNRRFIEGCLGGQRAGISAYQQCQGVQLRGASLLKLRQQRLSLVQQGLDLCEIQLRGRADFDAAPENAIGTPRGWSRFAVRSPRVRRSRAGQDSRLPPGRSAPNGRPGEPRRKPAKFAGRRLPGCGSDPTDPVPRWSNPPRPGTRRPPAIGPTCSGRQGPRASTLGAHAHGRKTIRALNAECGAGFLDAQRGHAQVAVVFQRSLDEALQQGSVKYACQASSPAWAPSVPDPRCAGQASGTGNGGVSGAGASDMQPVKTTALRANEAARNLNAGNNGEVGSMVTFRTGIGLKRVWSQRGNGCHPAMRGSWLVSAGPTFFASAVKPTSSPC